MDEWIMETRKVQVTGKSTYIVSVPKDWAMKAGLNSGSLLFVDAQENGSLLITANPAEHKPSRNRIINIDGKAGRALKRDIIAAYVTGVHIIEVRSKGLFPQQRTDIIDITRKLMGLEIVEESESKIIIQDFSNPEEIPLDKGFRRLCLVVQSLLLNVISAAKTRNVALASEAVSRCDDIYRMHYLILKQFIYIFRHSRVSQKNGLGLMDAFYYRLASDKLERIAYNASKMGKVIMEFEGDIPQDIAAELGETGMIAHEIVKDSVDSILKPDALLANKILEHDWKLGERLNNLRQSALGLQTTSAMSISTMADSFKRIEEHAINIAEFAIELCQTRQGVVS